MSVVSLALPDHLKKALSAGHPWVYRDHVPKGFQAPAGTFVKISCGNWSGYALWDPVSPIALRVFSEQRSPDAALVRERVRQAWELRQPLRHGSTSAYRLLFGEGDGLPGITVDLYGAYAVVLTYAGGLDVLLPWVVEALRAVAPLKGIVRRPRDLEAGASKLELLWGALPPRELVVEEHGARFHAHLFEGQKSGLFLDHRENRHTVRGLARDKSVLNLFAYTGGFSVTAALGGATRVTSVDIAEPAMRSARDNFALNGFDPEAHEFVASDVFEYLERTNSQARRFDLVVCDPPSFAKTREHLPQALKAYTRVSAMALRVTAPFGLYAAASCTSQVSPEAFKEMLAEAARQAKRRLQIIHEAGQPLDHPVLAQHREGRYLKFVLARALPVG